ncbi:glycosyltransferase family 2 protein [Xylophilus sp. GOD-11R]|uniref:glycosyltransferase family 2 protein n=1 Tax=Xylophilus sp. GOD-11R TaxID=3089814 RepID=UPI00298D46D2|nr:glycosyltransferase [Xylophilus sp. GOD-11R]WPB56114.1 glycosyltransferase [Xylophilus sp. GOD-11R]
MSHVLPQVSVCICTFKRPELLEVLLAELHRQIGPDAGVEFVVADNDPANSARPVLDAWADRLPLRALHVPVPNIASARNAVVGAAQAPWLAFIDDDESPDPGWLDKLRAAQAQYGADVVFAPVLPRYVPGTPDWLRLGGFFDRPRFATGTVIGTRDARTGNALLRAARVKALGPTPFDVAFGRTGAEDTVLFRELLARGAKYVWCDEATVQEDVPLARANASWLLRRSYRLGQTYLVSEIYQLRGLAWLLRAGGLGLRAVAQLVVAGVLALVLWPFSRIRSFRWLRAVCAQLGKLSALAGHRYHEYGG